ncbi:MAG: NUDIX domain-containing protein [Chthonomonas sp.]|nr:NUDIX domain-containing protein [Chthonomonas sp.]
MKRFPCGKFGRQTLEFFPAPHKAPLRSFIALVFCWQNDQVLVCDICDRGWCIPSGRVEPDESSCQAAHREALEEAGALLDEPMYIGCYRISEKTEIRWADVFVADIKELVEITMPEESRGRKLVSLEELPDIYHLWTPLTEQLFHHSRDVLARRTELGFKPCDRD